MSIYNPFTNAICIVCLEKLSGTNPNLYPCNLFCGHSTLCLACAEKLFNYSHIKCPQCQELTRYSDQSSIRINFTLKAMLEEYENSTFVPEAVALPSPRAIAIRSTDPWNRIKRKHFQRRSSSSTSPTSSSVSSSFSPSPSSASPFFPSETFDWALAVFEDFDETSPLDESEPKSFKTTSPTSSISSAWALELFGELDADSKIRLIQEDAASGMSPQEKLVKNLADNGVIDDRQGLLGKTVLIESAEAGALDKIELLINYGANVNGKDRDGGTALYFAAENGQVECLKFLITAGASLNTARSNGATPLMIAARKGYENILKELIQAGAQVDMRDSLCQSALMLAAMNMHIGCVDVLLNQGNADPNFQSINGDTALILAARWGCHICAKLLIDAGADVSIQNVTMNPFGVSASRQGQTAYEVAKENENNSCVALLEPYQQRRRRWLW